MRPESADVLVIGGGVAGLRCALHRTRAGASVMVLDKGRAPGGRMSTRRIGGAVWDHGVHRFIAQDPAFIRACAAWEAAGVARRDGGLWRGEPFMARIVEHEVDGVRAAGAEVRFQVTASELQRDLDAPPGRSAWRVQTRDATGEVEVLEAAEVVLACPPPQAAALLEGNGTRLAETAASVPMVPVWVLLARVRGETDPEVQAASPLASLDVRRLPGGSQTGLAVLGRPRPGWSVRHQDLPKAEAARRLAEGLVVRGGEVIEARAHRWLYAAVDADAAFERRRCWFGDGLVLCGDAYAGRGLPWGVESAWLSGEAAGGGVVGVDAS